jgi:hypothetical protein
MSQPKILRYKGGPIKVTYADGTTIVRKPAEFAAPGQKGESRRARYRDYLRSQQWQERRLAALKRAKNACSRCGSTERLEVHHPSYDNLGEERARQLVVLCRNCHAKHHGKSP